MSRYTPPTIESYGGIQQYLEATKDKHNGYGPKDLIKNWNYGKGKHMSVSALAIMFTVSWATMYGYIKRLHIEKGLPPPDKSIAKKEDIADNKK